MIASQESKHPDAAAELKDLEQSLQQYADELGQLNVIQSKYLESSEAMSKEILDINNRITKKKNRILQERKDKGIIHAKLVKVEEQKCLQQIMISRKSQFEEPSRNRPHEQSAAKEMQEMAKEIPSKNEGSLGASKEEGKSLFSPSKKAQEEIQLAPSKNEQKYINYGTSNYEPPQLNDLQDEEEEENEKQLMEKLRAKLRDQTQKDDD